MFLSLFTNAGDRNRTGTVLLRQDFKSCASASSATPAFISSTRKLYSKRTKLNGRRWIRTTEAICSRFTVCPLWPLGNPPIYLSEILLTRLEYSIRFCRIQVIFSSFRQLILVFHKVLLQIHNHFPAKTFRYEFQLLSSAVLTQGNLY